MVIQQFTACTTYRRTMDRFVVMGNPQGKLRPRFTRKGGGRTYTPQKTHDYEEYIRACYRQYVKKRNYLDDEPLFIIIDAYYPIPKSFSKTKRNMAIKGDLLPHSKPDVDNIAKVVLDALNTIAYVDDKLVTGLLVNKYYATVPRLCVQIGAFNEVSNKFKSDE